MASSLTRKQYANDDGCKQPATVICEGCSQAFCIKHLLDHRRLLSEEMNVIIGEHDHIQYTLNQQSTNPDSDPIIKQIDDWEKESIVKIQEKAKELRQQLLQFTTAQMDELSKKLRHLSEKLIEGRENDAYTETDLRRWKKTVEDLKANFVLPPTFSINRHVGIPLVENITIILAAKNELFERVFDTKVQIEENGQVATHDTSENHVEIRGKREYTSGRHQIRLRIERSSDRWTFLEINSTFSPLQDRSYSSKSTYGWCSNNRIWLNGSVQSNISTPLIEMKTNDVISLIFDCDNRKILMINERTNIRYELDVNIDHCSIPWQLHIIMREANSRVRILSTSS